MQLNIISFKEVRTRVDQAHAFQERKFLDITREVSEAIKTISGNGGFTYSVQMEHQYADRLMTFFETSPDHQGFQTRLCRIGIGGKNTPISSASPNCLVTLIISWNEND